MYVYDFRLRFDTQLLCHCLEKVLSRVEGALVKTATISTVALGNTMKYYYLFHWLLKIPLVRYAVWAWIFFLELKGVLINLLVGGWMRYFKNIYSPWYITSEWCIYHKTFINRDMKFIYQKRAVNVLEIIYEYRFSFYVCSKRIWILKFANVFFFKQGLCKIA